MGHLELLLTFILSMHALRHLRAHLHSVSSSVFGTWPSAFKSQHLESTMF
jgi:hypothetical protein